MSSLNRRLFQSPVAFFLLTFLLILLGPTVGQAARLRIVWTDNANNESGFRVERKIGTGGTFAQIAQLGANVVTYTEATLAAGVTYCYRVRAYNSVGNSGYTGDACRATINDTQAPTVTLTVPSNGATVRGSAVPVTAIASDPPAAGQVSSGVARVQFQLDDANLGAADTASPKPRSPIASPWCASSSSAPGFARPLLLPLTSCNSRTKLLNTCLMTSP